MEFLFFIYGGIVGSFLNVCIYRLPRHLSISKGGSFCPHCKSPIKWYDNIPWLSFLFLRGKCRNCKERISGRYFLIELLTALGFAYFYWQDGFTFTLWRDLTLFAICVIVFFIDLDYSLVFDRIVFPAIIVGLAGGVVGGNFISNLTGSLFAYLLFLLITVIGFLFFFRIGLIQVLREVLPSLNLGVISLWIKENLEDLLIPFILSGVIGFVIIFLYYLDKWFLGPSFIFPSFLANSMLVCMFIIFFSVYLTAILSTIWKSTRLRLYLQEMEYNTLFPIQQIIPFPSGVISMQLFFAESEPPPPLGLGDAKFAALLGSFVGLGKAFLGFWLAVWVGALVGGLGLAVSVVKGVYRPGKVGIPFAPAMVIGILLVVSKGEWLIKLWEKVNQIILMKF